MGILNFFKKDSFNMDTLEGIEKIKISKYPPIKGLESPIKNIEYILQRKATEHKKNGSNGFSHSLPEKIQRTYAAF